MKVAVAATLVLALAAPALAAEPAPSPEPKPRGGVPLASFMPLGLTAGYIVTGDGTKAVVAPLVVYGASFAGMVFGFTQAVDRATWKNPVGSMLDLMLSPLGWTMIGFGASTGIFLVDQALSPHAGGPWLAPAVSVGVMAGLVGGQLALDRRASVPFLDHHAGLALEQQHRLVRRHDRAAQRLQLDPGGLEVGAP